MKNQAITLIALLFSVVVLAQTTPEMCVVTVNQGTNDVTVAWDKTVYVGDYYNIYKETSPGTFTAIDNVPFGSLSAYTDATADPDVASISYKISSVVGSTESGLSAVHSTMFLVSNTGGSGEVNLSWTPYVGFASVSYNIWRGATSSSMTILDSIPSSLSSFVDASPLTGSSCYKIEVVNLAGCTPTSPATNYSSSYSNTTCETFVAIESLSNGQNVKVHVAPNPFSTSTSFSISGAPQAVNFELYNMIGKKVKNLPEVSSTSFEVSRDDLPNGIYLYRISSEKELLKTGKLIVE